VRGGKQISGVEVVEWELTYWIWAHGTKTGTQDGGWAVRIIVVRSAGLTAVNVHRRLSVQVHFRTVQRSTL
jgi:hypothetical protein